MSVEPLSLPVDSEAWSSYVAASVDDNVSRCRTLIGQLKDGEPRGAGEVLRLWNEIDLGVRNAESFVELMAAAHPDASVRSLAEERRQAVTRLVADRNLDPDLCGVLDGIDSNGLDPSAVRVLEHTLRDYRRAGVDRDGTVRQRLRDLAEQDVQLSQRYIRTMTDDVRVVEVLPARLAGLPQDFIDEHPPDADGRVALTTSLPDVTAVRMYATDPDVRRRLSVEYLNRGWPANDRVLAELLQVRAERARVLGYKDWADYDSEIKMIGNGASIIEFVEQIAAASAMAAQHDREVLLQRQQDDHPLRTSLDFADSEFYIEAVRRETFGVSAQEVRRYFDFEKVRAGLLEVTGRLFGLTYLQIDVPRWHHDVAVYDVFRDDTFGRRLGRVYLDLHPRAGKSDHATMYDLVPGIAGQQLPEGALVCNFSRGFMEHQHVVMLFHEFGHLIHHILAGDHEWSRFSGCPVEWDFVEAPSIMLEEWAWHPDVLNTFATDPDGDPIPADLVERMRAAKELGNATNIRRMTFNAALSYHLHHQCPDDITAVMRELQARYDNLDHIEGTHFYTGFIHLPDYTSGYYTYLWSLVIAKDLFSRFDPHDLFNPATARRYCDLVLAPGGSKNASDLIEDFLGRPYSTDAFSRSLLAATDRDQIADRR